jgi:uncharacterized membrane protein YsdA (DUF1294 family)/cold shock CspA family protein
MRHAGRLTDWNDDKGYGFVVPNGGGDRAFVHIRAFERPGRRPVDGDLLSYDMERDARGRINAVGVRFAGQRPVPVKESSAGGFRFPSTLLALFVFAAMAISGWLGKLPMPLLAVYGFMSVVAFFMYWGDKRSAREGEWRTPENTLHAVAVFGGWPGALLAQGVFRHKSRKTQFQVTFWFTVIVNCAIVIYLLRRGIQ